MCIWTSQNDSSQGIDPHPHTTKSEKTPGRLNYNSSGTDEQVQLAMFSSEEPSPYTRPAMGIPVFWRSPRTGIKCITSSAMSPSCLPIFKSNERETVNVAAKNVNTSQFDR